MPREPCSLSLLLLLLSLSLSRCPLSLQVRSHPAVGLLPRLPDPSWPGSCHLRRLLAEFRRQVPVHVARACSASRPASSSPHALPLLHACVDPCGPCFKPEVAVNPIVGPPSPSPCAPSLPSSLPASPLPLQPLKLAPECCPALRAPPGSRGPRQLVLRCVVAPNPLTLNSGHHRELHSGELRRPRGHPPAPLDAGEHGLRPGGLYESILRL